VKLRGKSPRNPAERSLVVAFFGRRLATLVFAATLCTASIATINRPMSAAFVGNERPPELSVAPEPLDPADLVGATRRMKSLDPGMHGKIELAQAKVAPVIAGLSPTSGPVGTRVTIQGANFTANNLIQFRGERMSFVVSSSPIASDNGISLQFSVGVCSPSQPQCPSAFIFSGIYKVTVNNANGESNEASFTITSLR
jgi:hypothetical protein